MKIFTLLVALSCAAYSAESVTENHPDGSKSLTVQINKVGERNGALTAWWPGGKLVKEKSPWSAGKLHGIRQIYDDKGQLICEETWLNGRLLYPQSQLQTVEALSRIERETVAYCATLAKPLNPTTAPLEAQARALTRLRQYRWFCGLAYDVGLDPTYTDEAQEGSLVLAAIGKLDHHPSKPPGWEDVPFEKAQEACGHGNLAMGAGSLSSAIDMWMNDSDDSNIDRLGHRRWLLNPTMQNCGLGITGQFQVIWAHDGKRSNPTSQQWQTFPPAGYMPITHFNERYAWHISLNPANYQVDLKATNFQIFPLDKRYVRNGAAYVFNFDNSNGDGFGSYANARIVRPDLQNQPKTQPPFQVSKGRSYEAVVGGLKPIGDAPAEIAWIVTFY